MDSAVRCAGLLRYTGGFHADTEALFGVGDRGRNNRPEVTDPVMPGRRFFNNRIAGFEMSGFGYR